jgi:hypothetical protein
LALKRWRQKMRKLKNLNLTEIYLARLLTFIQEVSYRLFLMTEGKLKDFFGKIFDKASEKHFELFFDMKLDSVCKYVQSGSLHPSTARSLTYKVLKPFATRQTKIQAKAIRLYQGKKISDNLIHYMAAVLTVHYITGNSTEECSKEMLQLLQEKIDAARKAS